MTKGGLESDFCYTHSQIDALALAACETVVAEPGKPCPYDVEAYQRIERRAVPTGEYPAYDPPPPIHNPLPSPLPPECIGDQPYHLRISGFRREGIFGPDEAAEVLVSAGVSFADSLGQGLFEHLVLCRKYGVVPVFEAPAAGFPFPFLESELPHFERIYRREISEFADWIRCAEMVYGHPILARAGQPWVLWGLHSPLALFMLSAARKPDQTAAELQSHSGIWRLEPSPTTPAARASQLRAWSFVRRRHMEVRTIMAKVLREVVSPDAVLIDNAHTLPAVDYELLGEIYDHPGVAARSGYLEDEWIRDANVAFAVRLFGDLTGKSPIASVRINLTAAGTRFIPGPQAVRNWCDAALRHGTAGYYFWPVDYPSSDGQYFGAMAGNTDPSARGRERWDAMLDLFGEIRRARCFQPPAARIGILVPYDQLELDGWRRVYNAFVALENQRILSRFVSGRAAAAGDEIVSSLDVICVPACPFACDRLVAALERFVHGGGTLILSCPEALMYDAAGNRRTEFAGREPGVIQRESETSHGFGKGTIFCVSDIVPVVNRLDVETYPWVYELRTSNVQELTGFADPPPTPAPAPELKLKHYMYEHSSSAILPYLDKFADFPNDESI